MKDCDLSCPRYAGPSPCDVAPGSLLCSTQSVLCCVLHVCPTLRREGRGGRGEGRGERGEEGRERREGEEGGRGERGEEGGERREGRGGRGEEGGERSPHNLNQHSVSCTLVRC